MTFKLSTESTIDLPYSYCRERDISVIFYTYFIGDQVFEDSMERDPKYRESYYQKIK